MEARKRPAMPEFRQPRVHPKAADAGGIHFGTDSAKMATL
jgi:hypothetical protein